jgi:hypothetical protein
MARGVRRTALPVPDGKQVLLRISGPGFVAGAVAVDGRIEACAPILFKHVMWVGGAAFKAICQRKGWTWEIVDQGGWDMLGEDNRP